MRLFELTVLPIQMILLQSEFDLGSLGELLEIERRVNRPQGQPIGFGGVVELIGRDQTGGAGNVLNNDIRGYLEMNFGMNSATRRGYKS
jgi:hypothetical protein